MSGVQQPGDRELVTRTHPPRGGSLCTEGKLRRAGSRRGEVPGRRKRRLARAEAEAGAGAKRGEPQGRKRVARHTHRQGGGNRRGGETPRGRNKDGKWLSHPEGGQASGDRRLASRSGLPGGRNGGGDLWTTPREEVRRHGNVAFEPQDRSASGKSARRSGGYGAFPQTGKTPPKGRVLAGYDVCYRARPRPRRTAAKAYEPHHPLEPPPSVGKGLSLVERCPRVACHLELAPDRGGREATRPWRFLGKTRRSAKVEHRVG